MTTSLRRTPLPFAAAAPAVLATACCCGFAFAQAAAPIEFKTVADALKSLEARDGNDTVVVHTDGWTIVNEPLSKAQWSFTPKGHEAYPAVVRRTVLRQGGDVSVDVSLLCEAGQAACAKLKTEFEGMNDRITQAIKARGRQGSQQSQPAPPPPVR